MSFPSSTSLLLFCCATTALMSKPNDLIFFSKLAYLSLNWFTLSCKRCCYSLSASIFASYTFFAWEWMAASRFANVAACLLTVISMYASPLAGWLSIYLTLFCGAKSIFLSSRTLLLLCWATSVFVSEPNDLSFAFKSESKVLSFAFKSESKLFSFAFKSESNDLNFVSICANFSFN